MRYNYALFKTTRFLSKRSKYRYFLASAFYNVYSDKEGDYHMDIRDKASLEERIWFYENKILGLKNYPLVSYPRLNGKNGCNLLEEQVIGLPDEVMRTTDSSGNPVTMTPAEIMRRIHFEEGLDSTVCHPNYVYSILNTDDYSVTYAINLLIANGFYVLNPERIYYLNEAEEEAFYPVFVDERKVPEEMKNRKVSADRLLMDFDTMTEHLDKASFLKYMKPIDSMSFSELAEYAFVRQINQMKGVEYESHMMVRRYFYALIRQLLNQFYFELSGRNHLFGYSVLDSDFHSHVIPNHHLCYGQNFRMFFFEEKRIHEENGVLRETSTYQPYFDERDKKYIIRVYDFVHKTFFNGIGKSDLIPSLYLKRMGLPSEVFEMVKYFDFWNGTGKDFAKLLPFGDYPNFFKDTGFKGAYLRTDGALFYDSDAYESSILIANHPEMNLFISEPGYLYDDLSMYFSSPLPMPFYFFSYLKSEVFSDSEMYHRLVEEIEARMNQDGIPLQKLDQIKAFVLEDGSEPKMKVMSEFFGLLQDGYRSDEAYSVLSPKLPISYNETLLLVVYAIRNQIRSYQELYEFNNQYRQQFFLPLLNRIDGEIIDLSTKQVLCLGRNFIGYYVHDSETPVLDESDRVPLMNLIEIYRRYFQNRKTFRFSSYSYVSGDYEKKTTPTPLLEFLGLPWEISRHIFSDRDILSQIRFEHCKSIFDEKHMGVIAEDKQLMHLYLNHLSLEQGVYMVNGDGVTDSCQIYALRERLSPLMERVLDPTYLQLVYIDIYCDSDAILKKDLFFMSPSAFRDQIMPYILEGKRAKKDSFMEGLSLNFLSCLTRSFVLDMLLDCHFGDLRKFGYFRNVSFFTKQKDTYLAFGESFFAYSKSLDLDGFAFRKKDLSGLLLSVNASLRLYQKESKERQIRLATIASGVPYILMKELYQILKGKKKNEAVSEEDLLSQFRFTDRDVVSVPFGNYVGPFFTSRESGVNYDYANSIILNSLLEQGCYVRDEGTVFAYVFTQDQDVDMTTLNEKMKPSLVFLDEKGLSGAVKEFLAPDDTCFIYLVGAFVRKLLKKNISKNTLFYIQEFLFYLFDKDPLFLVHYLNWNKEENPLSSKYEKFNLKPLAKKVHEEEMMSYLNLFVLDLLKRTYEKTLKQILKK